jgi:hypothetical protein
MRKLILLAGAAMMAAAGPAVAKPGGGKPAAKAQAGAKAKAGPVRTRADVRNRTQVRSGGHARTDARANVRARTRTGAAVDRRLDTNGNGIPDYRESRLADANGNGIPDYRESRMVDTNGNGVADWRERWIDRDRDGMDDRAQRRVGAEGCPPGLARKTPACVPPGQAKRMFEQGQRIPLGYDYFTRYEDIPVVYRDRYSIPTGQQYVYRDRSVYVVDPATRLVTRVIDLID